MTIAHEYRPAYPEQLTDYSYGIGQDMRLSYLIPPKAPLRYHVPASDVLGTAWTADTFDDTAWHNGSSGIGYVTTVPGFAARNFQATTSVSNLATAEDVISDLGLQAGVDVDNPDVIDYQGTGAPVTTTWICPFPVQNPEQMRMTLSSKPGTGTEMPHSMSRVTARGSSPL